MYVKITVRNCDDKLKKYEWKTLSKFLELMESDSVDLKTIIPMPDDKIETFEYVYIDFKIHWDMYDLKENDIVIVEDLYNWLCSDACDWFDN